MKCQSNAGKRESVVLVGNGSELISFLQVNLYVGVFQTELLFYLADLLLDRGTMIPLIDPPTLVAPLVRPLPL